MTFLKISRVIPIFGCFVVIMAGNTKRDDKKTNDAFYSKDSIFAAYQYRTSDDLAGTAIDLKYDKSFLYFTGTDVQQSFSSGNWEMVKDTLVLRSFIKKDEIPVTIKESTSAHRDSLIIEWVNNLQGDIVKGATVFINGDNSEKCMPVFDECKFAVGSVRKIRLTFGNNCSTKWHEIKNAGTNKIETIVNVNFSLDSYVFLANKKFLIRKKGLYELREVVKKIKGKEKIFLVQESSFFYKRIK
jgi:hypothetical protein